jgi:hypothetical protein
MQQESYRLVVRRGPQPNQSFELSKDVTTLGRDITNDIVINDREVSRHHMRLTRSGEGYSIEDLGSTNGTFINGKRVSGIQPLKNGDIIGLGETVTLVYERARGPVVAAPQIPGQQPAGAQPEPAAMPQQQMAPPVQPQPPPQPTYELPPQQPAYQPPPQQGYYAPAGYEGYDPYEVREGGGNNTLKWVAIGCGGLLLLCCCLTIVALFIIDAQNLWCDIPILRDILAVLNLC